MFGRFKRLIFNADDIIASLSLILIIIISVIGVFMRYVLDEPLSWTEEVSLALFIWFTFLGSSSVVKRNGHVGIDYFVLKFPPKLQFAASIFKETIMVVITLVVLVYFGSQLTLQAGDKITPVLGIKYSFIDVSVVLGGFLGFIHIIRHILSNINIVKNEPPISKTLPIREERKA